MNEMEGCESGRIDTFGKRERCKPPWVQIPLLPQIRKNNAYLVGAFDTQNGVFKPGAYVGSKTVDGVTSWIVTLEVRSDAAWSDITKACSALSSSCPTGRIAFIADGQVISASSSPADVYGLSGSVELSGFSTEAEARAVAADLSRA